MKRKILTTALALMALTFTFNSCKEDDPEPKKKDNEFPYDKVKITETDSMVFSSIDEINNFEFWNENYEDIRVKMFVGKYPEPDSLNSYRKLEPNTKYYWCLQTERETPGGYILTSEKSEIRSFYYVTAPKITVHNVEGDWAAVVTWEHNDMLKDATITLTPDKDCEYDKTPIIVSAAQDSCYISAGSEFSKKYAVYHQWWDDSKAQYYEPVIYDFTATFSGEIDGIPYTVATEPVKYIFLDRAVYAADKQFNVYRMGQIGNRTWLLDDLRGEISIHNIFTSPMGFKTGFYPTSNEPERFGVIPEGFHLASDDDWQDLEYTYGIDKQDCNNYKEMNTFDISNSKVEGETWFDDEKNDTIKYVGQNVDITQKLMSKNEWNTIDSSETIIDGWGTFNARPFGWSWSGSGSVKPFCVGTMVVFLTSTIDEERNAAVVRVIWSGNKGIERLWAIDAYRAYYVYRCVKNE